jgi:hypothetical protein
MDPGVMEAVNNAVGYKHHIFGVDEQGLAVEEELDLARDHVEGLGRAVVGVRLLPVRFSCLRSES